MSLTRARRRSAAFPEEASSGAARDREAVHRPAVAVRRPVRQVANWQRTDRWFWFGEASLTGPRELVVPLGEHVEQGPHQMTRFRTLVGAIRACSVEYFERNTELAQGLRPVR